MKNTTVIITTLIIIATLFLAKEKQCEIKAQAQNMEYQFGILKGCIVKKNNKWIDYNILRETN